MFCTSIFLKIYDCDEMSSYVQVNSYFFNEHQHVSNLLAFTQCFHI